jgi:hypothetical protein
MSLADMPVSALGCKCTETAQRNALLQVSAEVVSEGADADLIILEGMGRGIETNLHAQFTVDALKLGMIKHREVCPTPVACSLLLHFVLLCELLLTTQMAYIYAGGTS